MSTCSCEKQDQYANCCKVKDLSSENRIFKDAAYLLLQERNQMALVLNREPCDDGKLILRILQQRDFLQDRIDQYEIGGKNGNDKKETHATER